MLSCYSFHNHTLLSHSMWSLWNLRSLRVFQGDGSYHWRLGDAFKISWVNWCLEHAPGKTLNTENLPDLLGTLTLCYTHTYFAVISGFIWDFTFLIPTIRVPHAFLSDWRVCVQAQTYQRGNSNSDGPAFIPSLAFLSSAASETSRCETATYHYVCMYVCMYVWWSSHSSISPVPGERLGQGQAEPGACGDALRLTVQEGVSCWKACPWRFGSFSSCLHFLCPDSDGDKGSNVLLASVFADYPRVLTIHLWPTAQVPWG